MGLGLYMARQVGEVDAVDGAVGGEDVPFLVDFDTCIGVAGNEAELLVVVARVIYERGDVVMREAGVLAGGAEEAAAHRLRELFVGRELDSELVARAGIALGVQQAFGDVAERHVRGGERFARLGAMTALRALA